LLGGRAGLTILHAWNEDIEQGRLVATLLEGAARLDTLRTVLRPESNTGLIGSIDASG
jgi:hypothetical protein